MTSQHSIPFPAFLPEHYHLFRPRMGYDRSFHSCSCYVRTANGNAGVVATQQNTVKPDFCPGFFTYGRYGDSIVRFNLELPAGNLNYSKHRWYPL